MMEKGKVMYTVGTVLVALAGITGGLAMALLGGGILGLMAGLLHGILYYEERKGAAIDVCHETYQLVGQLSEHVPEADKWLDNLSEARIVHEGLLPVTVTFPVVHAKTNGLLDSMATCLNHAHGLLTEEEKVKVRYDMAKLYDEVVGKGYYRGTQG